MLQKYCKSGNFRENFIFANSVKRQTCDVKNSRLWHDLSKSVIDRVILRGFLFSRKLNPREKYGIYSGMLHRTRKLKRGVTTFAFI